MMGPKPVDPLKRFESFYIPEPNSGCWLWGGGTRFGYGRFWFEGKCVPAHRWSYEKFVGPIPGGLEVDHLCFVRCCVNPDHLEAVTKEENNLRFHRANGGESNTCIRGHSLEGDNLAYENQKNGRPRRRCRRCAHDRVRAWYEANPMVEPFSKRLRRDPRWGVVSR